MRRWLLYGCTGYSGRLIAQHAVSQGLTPVLAGRDPVATRAVADALGLPYRCFSLRDSSAILDNICDCFLVFNAAGPYTDTALPLLDACMEAGVHNLSLVGEIPLLETLHDQHQRAVNADILVAPGLGFDVYPTDCLIHLARQQLQDATTLTLILDGPNDLSAGSTKELIQQLAETPFWVRRGGQLVASAPRLRLMPLHGRRRLLSSVAWGDTATAYHSTGIPNIEVLTTVTVRDLAMIGALRAARGLMRLTRFRSWVYHLVDALVAGPDSDRREQASVGLTVRLRNVDGASAQASIRTPSAYRITYLAAVAAIEHVLKADTIVPGYRTPAQLMGAESLFELPGVADFALQRG